MMRIPKALLTVVFASLSYAETLPAPQGQQDVLVIDHSWRSYRRDVSVKGVPEGPSSQTPIPNPTPRTDNQPASISGSNQGLSIPPPHPPILVTEYAYTLKLRNVGTKTVRGVGWDYIFIDPTSQQELGRHNFQSLVKIGKGSQSTVIHSSTSPPTRIVSESALHRNSRNPFTEQILITCLKYNDGTVWIADPSRQHDCQTSAVRRR